MRKVFLKNKGYTLVETLVAIAIMGILFLIITPYYKTIRGTLALNRSASKLAQDIRGVQEMAISSQDFLACQKFGAESNQFHENYERGYGIYVDLSDDYYILFADCDGDHMYSNIFDSSLPDEHVNIAYLENDICIYSISDEVYDAVTIAFIPPDPLVLFFVPSGVLVPGTYHFISIDLKNDYINKYKMVKVNKAGLINVDDN